MKTFLKLSLMFVFTLGISATTFAQATTTARTDATIVTPIDIDLVDDLEYGNISVSSTSTGTVVMAPASGSAGRTATGGVVLPAVTGTVNAAQFLVSGEGSYTYAITLPAAELTITNSTSGNSETMEVNTFTSIPDGTGTLDAGGTQTLYVGATLDVDAGQASGSYTSSTGDFSVTVVYN